MPKSGLLRSTACFDKFYIGHELNDKGYDSTWYDALDTMSDLDYNFHFIPTTTDGNLYFTAETYYSNVVPKLCT